MYMYMYVYIYIYIYIYTRLVAAGNLKSKRATCYSRG